MPREEDDRISEWEEAATTYVTGAVPLEAPEDETTPRRTLCPRCVRPVRIGGDAAHPTFEEMDQNASGECWVSLDTGLGKAWWFCSSRRPYILMLSG